VQYKIRYNFNCVLEYAVWSLNKDLCDDWISDVRLVLLIYNWKIVYILTKNQHRRRLDVGVKSKTNIPTAELQEWHRYITRSYKMYRFSFVWTRRYNTLGLWNEWQEKKTENNWNPLIGAKKKQCLHAHFWTTYIHNILYYSYRYFIDFKRIAGTCNIL